MLVPQQQPYGVAVPQSKVYHGVAGGKYTLINTMPAWKALHAELMIRKYLACDTETNSKKWSDKEPKWSLETEEWVVTSSHIVGFSFSWGAENSYYIPVRHETGEKQLKIEDILDDLKALFGRRDLITVWHNAKFDLHFLRLDGIEVRGVCHDTLIMYKLIDENSSAELKEIAKREIHPDSDKWEKLLNEYRIVKGRTKIPAPTVDKPNRKLALKKENVHYGMVILEIMCPYAASDTHYAWVIFKWLLPEVLANADFKRLYINELRLTQALLKMESDGMFIDRPHLEKIGPELDEEIDSRGAEIIKELGDINIDSRDQLVVAFQKKGVKFTKMTKTKKYALTAEILEKLATKHQICEDVLKRKKIKKLRTTYVKNILEKMDEGYYLHTTINQNVVTGRMSSSDPNLQNMPNPKDELSRLIRSAFIPPPGFIMLFVDYSQIEVRLTAHYSEDPVLLKVYCETFEDVHLRTCCEMFGYDYDEAQIALDDENHPLHHEVNLKRKVAKQINFLIIYGGGAELLAQKISTPKKTFTKTQCKQYIDAYKARLSGVNRWINREKIYIQRALEGQNYFGRTRRLHKELQGASLRRFSDNYTIERAKRQWVNFLIQGTAGDLFKYAIVRVNDMLREEKAKSRIVNVVHDEIIFYLHQTEMYLLPIIKELMEDWHFKVPVVADFAYSTKNWASKKELKPAA
jgi:DNA polymerase-1